MCVRVCGFSSVAKGKSEILMMSLGRVCAHWLSEHISGVPSVLAPRQLQTLLYRGYTYIMPSSPSTSLCPAVGGALNTHVFVSTYLPTLGFVFFSLTVTQNCCAPLLGCVFGSTNPFTYPCTVHVEAGKGMFMV